MDKVSDKMGNIVDHLAAEEIFPSGAGGDQNRAKRRMNELYLTTNKLMLNVVGSAGCFNTTCLLTLIT